MDLQYNKLPTELLMPEISITDNVKASDTGDTSSGMRKGDAFSSVDVMSVKNTQRYREEDVMLVGHG